MLKLALEGYSDAWKAINPLDVLFSFKGRIGRRDFWIWIGLWFVGMLALFSLAGKNLLDIQTAAFCLVCLLWPTAAVTVKRLHDRGRSGACMARIEKRRQQ